MQTISDSLVGELGLTYYFRGNLTEEVILLNEKHRIIFWREDGKKFTHEEADTGREKKKTVGKRGAGRKRARARARERNTYAKPYQTCP